MVLFWIFFGLSIVGITGFFYHFKKFKQDRLLKEFDKKYKTIFISISSFFSLAVLGCAFGIVNWNNFSLDGLHYFMLISGSLIFGLGLITLISCFVIFYYKDNLDEKLKKLIHKIMYISIPFVAIFFVISVESYTYYMPLEFFPLISGINFSGEGIKFISANNHPSGGFTITWYGLIIITGAIIAYFVCDSHFAKEYKRHGLIDTMFVLVLVMGILGARFWYCAVLEHDLSNFFDFQNGGLAIMGGVIFGATFGILFLIFFRRYINLRHAMDMILPCVLIAQSIGRWGNFFNQEVFGSMTFEYNSVWWLPTFIKNQMTINGLVHLPLFLVEFFTNLIGYFVIVYLVGKLLKKHLSFGDQFCLYFSWYGLTRVILEPMRESTFEYNASYVFAWVMFGGGLAAIFGLHLYDFIRYKKYTFNIKKNDNKKFKNNVKNPYRKIFLTDLEVNKKIEEKPNEQVKN